MSNPRTPGPWCALRPVTVGLLLAVAACSNAAAELPTTTPPTTTRATTAVATTPGDRVVVEGTVVVNHGEHDSAGEIRDADGRVPTDPSDVIHAASVFPGGDGSLVEVVAPDGEQVTLADWLGASGTATLECLSDGSLYTLDFEGLIPNGVYTLWQHLMSEQVEPDERVAPLGTAFPVASGSLADAGRFEEAMVVGSATGEARVEIVSRAGPMSMMGERSACPLLDHPTIYVILDYHIDGETYGPVPGPDAFDAGHVHILFQQEDVP